MHILKINGRFYHGRVYFETVLAAKFVVEGMDKNKISKGFNKIKNQKPWLGKGNRDILLTNMFKDLDLSSLTPMKQRHCTF